MLVMDEYADMWYIHKTEHAVRCKRYAALLAVAKSGERGLLTSPACLSRLQQCESPSESVLWRLQA